MSENQFYSRFKLKSDEELQKIIDSPDVRVPAAIEAAKLIIDERSGNTESTQVIQLESSSIQNSTKISDVQSTINEKNINISLSLRSIAAFLILHGLVASQAFANVLNVSWDYKYLLAYSLMLLIVASSILGGIYLFQKNKIGLYWGSMAMLLMIPYFKLGSISFFNAGLTTILIRIYPPLHFEFNLFSNKIGLNWGIVGGDSIFAVNIVGFVGFGILQMALNYLYLKKEWPSHLH
jgi:hypothetical protein